MAVRASDPSIVAEIPPEEEAGARFIQSFEDPSGRAIQAVVLRDAVRDGIGQLEMLEIIEEAQNGRVSIIVGPAEPGAGRLLRHVGGAFGPLPGNAGLCYAYSSLDGTTYAYQLNATVDAVKAHLLVLSGRANFLASDLLSTEELWSDELRVQVRRWTLDETLSAAAQGLRRSAEAITQSELGESRFTTYGGSTDAFGTAAFFFRRIGGRTPSRDIYLKWGLDISNHDQVSDMLSTLLGERRFVGPDAVKFIMPESFLSFRDDAVRRSQGVVESVLSTRDEFDRSFDLLSRSFATRSNAVIQRADVELYGSLLEPLDCAPGGAPGSLSGMLISARRPYLEVTITFADGVPVSPTDRSSFQEADVRSGREVAWELVATLGLTSIRAVKLDNATLTLSRAGINEQAIRGSTASDAIRFLGATPLCVGGLQLSPTSGATFIAISASIPGRVAQDARVLAELQTAHSLGVFEAIGASRLLTQGDGVSEGGGASEFSITTSITQPQRAYMCPIVSPPSCMGFSIYFMQQRAASPRRMRAGPLEHLAVLSCCANELSAYDYVVGRILRGQGLQLMSPSGFVSVAPAIDLTPMLNRNVVSVLAPLNIMPRGGEYVTHAQRLTGVLKTVYGPVATTLRQKLLDELMSLIPGSKTGGTDGRRALTDLQLGQIESIEAAIRDLRAGFDFAAFNELLQRLGFVNSANDMNPSLPKVGSPFSVIFPSITKSLLS